MVVRKTLKGLYWVGGEAYIHGIMDRESILGPITLPWQICYKRADDGGISPQYWNPETNIMAQEDPRLGDLPPGWSKLDRERIPDSPLHYSPHQNLVTGEEINSDPRLLPNALIARGIKLEQFWLA